MFLPRFIAWLTLDNLQKHDVFQDINYYYYYSLTHRSNI